MKRKTQKRAIEVVILLWVLTVTVITVAGLWSSRAAAGDYEGPMATLDTKGGTLALVAAKCPLPQVDGYGGVFVRDTGQISDACWKPAGDDAVLVTYEGGKRFAYPADAFTYHEGGE